jgi:hypothetical protein
MRKNYLVTAIDKWQFHCEEEACKANSEAEKDLWSYHAQKLARAGAIAITTRMELIKPGNESHKGSASETQNAKGESES